MRQHWQKVIDIAEAEGRRSTWEAIDHKERASSIKTMYEGGAAPLVLPESCRQVYSGRKYLPNDCSNFFEMTWKELLCHIHLLSCGARYSIGDKVALARVLCEKGEEDDKFWHRNMTHCYQIMQRVSRDSQDPVWRDLVEFFSDDLSRFFLLNVTLLRLGYSKKGLDTNVALNALKDACFEPLTTAKIREFMEAHSWGDDACDFVKGEIKRLLPEE